MTIPDKLVTAAAEAIHKTEWHCDHVLPDEPNCVHTARKALAAAFAALPELAVQIKNESITLIGCDQTRRRWCCSYHEGMDDAFDMLLARMGEP